MSRTDHHRRSLFNQRMSTFKKTKRRKEKAKEKQAIKNGDYQPKRRRKTDKYEFL